MFFGHCLQADLLRSCETGCRLLSIIDTISIGDWTEEGTAASINNCNRSCDASYSDLEVATACKQGCLYQVRTLVVLLCRFSVRDLGILNALRV